MDPGRRAEMAACAKLGARPAARGGRAVDTIDTGGFPMVVGRFFQDPSFPTVTVYNHLDVQPADGEGWQHAAVQADARHARRRRPTRWFARGATDDKGPALTALYGARLAIENGVRANIQFLWELEEEIGSPHFAAGLAAAVAGDAPPGARRSRPIRWSSPTRSGSPPGQPSISYGLRGLMGFTVALETGAKDVHSGTTGGARAQPDRRARRADRRVLRRAHGQGEDPGLLRRRAQAVGRRAQGVRARAASRASASPAAHELGVAAPDPRRRRRPGRADRGADLRGARPRRRLRRARHQDHRPPPRRG